MQKFKKKFTFIQKISTSTITLMTNDRCPIKKTPQKKKRNNVCVKNENFLHILGLKMTQKKGRKYKIHMQQNLERTSSNQNERTNERAVTKAKMNRKPKFIPEKKTVKVGNQFETSTWNRKKCWAINKNKLY